MAISHIRRLGKQALVHSRRADLVAGLLRRFGAHELADRVRAIDAGREVAVLPLPESPLSRSSGIKMYTLDGRDQVARALRDGGWEAFEAPLPTAVLRCMQRWQGTLLDVGANTGLYSLIAAAADPKASAIAFEPVPEIFQLLEANVALNGFASRVEVDQVAISDHSGWATLHLPPPQTDGTIETSASLEHDFKEEIERTFEVRASTLDDAWRLHGRPRVTVVKIDVEGSEARVLAGAALLIEACAPIVSVEVLARIAPAPLEALRARIGYVDVTLSPRLAVVGRPAVRVDPEAPNHLLVPPSRLDPVLDELSSIGGLTVSVVG